MGWRDLFHFEMPEAGGGGPAVVDPAPPAAPPAARTPAAPEPAGFQVPQDQWEAVVRTTGSFADFLDQARAEEARRQAVASQPNFDDFDPFERSQVEQLIESRVGHMLQDRLDRLESLTGVVAQREAQSVAMRLIEDLSKHESIGGLTEHGKARSFELGKAYMQEGVEPTTAFARAVQETKAFEKQMMDAGAEAYRARVAAAAGATPEPAAGSGVATPEVAVSPTSKNPYREQAALTLARVRATQTPAEVG